MSAPAIVRTQQDRRLVALDVLTHITTLLRPEMRARLSISAIGGVEITLDTEDAMEGHTVARLLRLSAEPPYASEFYAHHAWSGHVDSHPVRISVLVAVQPDRRAQP